MNNYSITDVLTHREPMILIDSIDQYDNESCTCQVLISDSSPFYQVTKKGVPSYIGCEYMAQSIAAFSGAQSLDEKKPVSIGFLLGSRKYESFQTYFTISSQLSITVTQLYKEDSGLSVYDCDIYDGEKRLLAKAKINVFQPEDPEEFIKDSA